MGQNYFTIIKYFSISILIIFACAGCISQKSPPKGIVKSTKSLNKMITIYIEGAHIKNLNKGIEISVQRNNISKIILFNTKPFKIIKQLNSNHLRDIPLNNIVTTNIASLISSQNHKMI